MARARILFPAERSAAFLDAVVAIAMTLLILPLMEGAADVRHGESVLTWLQEHAGQLIGFGLSFVLTATFWMREHQMFLGVKRVDAGLMWLTIGWLATVVWLPVATALTGASPDTDTVVKGLYIGSLTAVVLMLALQRGWLLRHPDLRETDDATVARGLSFDLSMLLLYVLALVVVLIFPMTSYIPLFLMVLVSPVQRVLGRFVERRHAPAPDAPAPDAAVPDTPAQDESSTP